MSHRPPPSSPGDAPRIERTADGSLTLHHPGADQTYGSGHGALSEARHVYLAGSGVAARLAAGRATRVLEVGLGTGLNLLVTADAAVAAGAELDYHALETLPPPAETLRSLAYQRHLAHPELAEAWISMRATLDDDAPPALLRGALAPGVRLEARLGDATARPSLADPGWADAIYHDAFSPDAAPELWSEAFLARLVEALAPGGTLVSYSVKGVVRRRLAALGLHVEKPPGPPGGKREMLRAVRPA